MIGKRAVAFALVLSSASAFGGESPSSPIATLDGVGSTGVELRDIDRNIDACTDFHEFANGTWRAENPIPVSMSRWSRRVAAHETNRQRVQSILDDVSKKSEWLPGSKEQQLGDYYASCMDESGIEATGLSPLLPLLARIDAIRTSADVQNVIRRLHELAIAVPFGSNGVPDYQTPTRYIENIVAGGLGLPTRDYYSNEEPKFADAREKYREHVARTLVLSGTPESQAYRAANDIFALERRLARVSLDSAAASDQATTYHKTSFAQLKRMAPHIDWDSYFDDAKLPRTELNVAEPKFVQQLDKEFKETSVATWKAYLKWQLLRSVSPFLSRDYVDESFRFNDEYLGGATTMSPRAQRCSESTEALFGAALGKKYVERYFPPAAKAKVREIALNLLTTLTDDVATLDWMSPATKTKAIAKLSAVDLQLGYPDQWTNYSNITVRRDSFWRNVAAARKFAVESDRLRIGKQTNRDLWALSPASADAYIDLQLNLLVLPAGFLQPPFFSIGATDAVNYGALGIALAHDLTHAIDASGSEIDVLGRPVNWWTEADRAEFGKRSQCVVDQFDGYFIEPGIHHDGKRVLSESIGDLGGTRIAFQALEHSMKTRPAPIVDGFTPQQQFFISWGQNTGAAMRQEAQRKLVGDDPHPTPKFRVIGPLSNAPEFQQAFSCKASDTMVRPTGKRCAIW